MKRRLLVLVLCAAFGAIVTVAVAWRATQLGARGGTWIKPDLPQTAELWRRHVPVEWGHETIIVDDALALPEGHEEISAEVYTGPGVTTVYLYTKPKGECEVVQAGWPFRALEGTEIRTSERTTRHGIWGPPYGSGWPDRTALGGYSFPCPFHLMWPGFAADTLLCGAITWLLVAVVFRIRRRARLDRGTCPRCTYDLRAAPGQTVVTCSECGARIAAASFARPRQVFRWWMLPALVPAALLGVLFLVGRITWPLVRRKLMWPDAMAAWATVVVFTAAAVGLYVLAFRSYPDRASGPRHVISALVALAAAGVALLPLYVLVARVLA